MGFSWDGGEKMVILGGLAVEFLSVVTEFGIGG